MRIIATMASNIIAIATLGITTATAESIYEKMFSGTYENEAESKYDELFGEAVVLHVEGDRLRAEASRLDAEPHILRAESYRLAAESNSLRAESARLFAEAYRLESQELQTRSYISHFMSEAKALEGETPEDNQAKPEFFDALHRSEGKE